MRFSEPLAGLVFLSGFPVRPELLESERHPANADLPVLVCHGTHDQMLPWLLVQHGILAVKSVHRNVEVHTYAMGHEVCPDEITRVRDWLHLRLAA